MPLSRPQPYFTLQFALHTSLLASSICARFDLLAYLRPGLRPLKNMLMTVCLLLVLKVALNFLITLDICLRMCPPYMCVHVFWAHSPNIGELITRSSSAPFWKNDDPAEQSGSGDARRNGRGDAARKGGEQPGHLGATRPV